MNTLVARQREGWITIKEFLFPGGAEQDDGFRDEIRRRSAIGLYIIAAVTAIMPVLGYLLHVLANIDDPAGIRFPTAPLLLLALGGAMLVAIRTSWGHRRARLLAFLEGLCVATTLVWANLLGYRSISADPVLSALIDIIIVLVVALTAIPARPMQMAAFGWAIAWINFLSAVAAVQRGYINEDVLRYYAAFDLIVILCTVLAGFNYQLLLGNYLAQIDRLSSQSRLLHSETAVSFSRLSATLSHELNSPLGALRSSLDSLRSLRLKEETEASIDPARAKRVADDLFTSAGAAVEKLNEIANRIERFTNLDRAESTSVEVDKMLADVVHMLSPAGEGPKVTVTAGELPALTLRPQPISSVFSRLVQNAVEANEDGSPVEVNAHADGDYVTITVRDRGRGLADKELSALFEPRFRTKGSRVGASNWGLFTARQIIREHGGDISAARAEGGGTIITVRLPVDGPLTADEPSN